MANDALLEWPDNISISAAPPSEYVPLISERFSSTLAHTLDTDYSAGTP
jgi:hypothetical protein